MKIDYSLFNEDVDEGVDGFSDLDTSEQMRITSDVFPIGCIVNIHDEQDFTPFTDTELKTNYHVIGYIAYTQSDYYDDKVINILLHPVGKEYEPIYIGRNDNNTKSLHPGFLKHNIEWLRENKLENLLD